MRCSKCRCELRVVHVGQKQDTLLYQYACKNRQCPAYGKIAEERERPEEKRIERETSV